MSYPPPSHRGSRSAPPPRPRPETAGESYRSSRLRTATRSGGRQRSAFEPSVLEPGDLEPSDLERRVLQVEPLAGSSPVAVPRALAPEWLLLLRAGLGRERVAMTVAVTAVSIAALVIVVIPVITGRIG
ncbi:MAG: hypothetical protein OEW83_15485 [Acidimicrobiia bacterium]|nr:hypothetical protein [Acidimicrobiia bacterium]